MITLSKGGAAMNPTENEKAYDSDAILQYLLSNGMIDLDGVADSMNKAQRKRISEKHTAPITQGKDGRYRTYIKLEDGKRKQIAKSTLESVENELVEFYSGKAKEKLDAKITLESLYPEWCEWKVLRRSASSYMTRIDTDWKTYYLNHPIVKTPIKELNKLTLDKFAHGLIERTGRRRKAYYNASLIIRSILDLAVDKELIKENLFRKVRINTKIVFGPEKKQSSESQVYTVAELEKLYELAWKDFSNGHNTVQKLAPLAVLFAFQTGIRRGEMVTLRYKDICEDEICVQRMYRFESKEVINYLKGHRDCRYVPLTTEAKRLIDTAKEYQREHGLPDDVYIFSVNNEPLSYYSLGQLYNRYCKLIGTVPKSSHKARKTYISALIDGGVNINTIREIVAHSSEKTTYNSYVYDRKPKSKHVKLIEKALA